MGWTAGWGQLLLGVYGALDPLYLLDLRCFLPQITSLLPQPHTGGFTESETDLASNPHLSHSQGYLRLLFHLHASLRSTQPAFVSFTCSVFLSYHRYSGKVLRDHFQKPESWEHFASMFALSGGMLSCTVQQWVKEGRKTRTGQKGSAWKREQEDPSPLTTLIPERKR